MSVLQNIPTIEPGPLGKWMNGMDNNIKMRPEDINQGKAGPLGTVETTPEITERCPPDNRFVDITAMIRSLQRTEGSNDCFRRGIADCDQLNCSWREYCLNCPD